MKKEVHTYNGSTWTLAESRIFIYDDRMECESMKMVVLAPSEGLRQRVPACGRWRNNMIEEAIIPAGSSTVSQVKYYIWGNDLSGSRQGAHSAGSGPSAGGVGGLLAKTSTSSSVADAFYHFDANGNVIALSDATGKESATYEYSAFGDIIATTGPAADSNPFKFSTKYQDAASGFLYYGFRSYDPETGRWLNRDPIRESGGLNAYAFVGNAPVGYFDYLGMIGAGPDLSAPGVAHSLWVEYQHEQARKTSQGQVTPFFGTLMSSIASKLSSPGGSVSFTWSSPPLGSPVNASFGLKIEGTAERCCDRENNEESLQFRGSIVGTFSVGVGIGSESGPGVTLVSAGGGSSEFPDCSTDIEDIEYELFLKAYAGFGGKWSLAGEQSIASCSASSACQWTVREGPSFSFGGGETGARIFVGVEANASGTYWPN